ncbi:putative profilin [Trypanosoma cruzi]|nr:putative profilin [Trypanosoma cruzi]
MQAEARVVRLALSAFSAILPSTMDILVDNTSPQGAANKGSSKSHAMTWGPQRMCLLTLAECGQLLPTYGLQKTPQMACHAVVFYTSALGEGGEVAKGSGGFLWLDEPQVFHFVTYKNRYIESEWSERATIVANG